MVFCGGIGENAAVIRERICDDLAFLGIEINRDANAQNAVEIGSGATRTLVIPTDEERVIARAVSAALGSAGHPSVGAASVLIPGG